MKTCFWTRSKKIGKKEQDATKYKKLEKKIGKYLQEHFVTLQKVVTVFRLTADAVLTVTSKLLTRLNVIEKIQ
ncbi:MAG: hypothetical protein NUK63_06170 [Candidatus Bathyarchaeum tardum]|nr:MAG: hypothetical protein NUK63_06170 [Candidatus Bathyarchaeum tardum]